MNRIVRDRPLTPQEAEKYAAIRAEIAAELPELKDRIRRQRAELRQARASAAGVATLGQRLREARERLGASPGRIAEQAGISAGFLSQLETDEREPTLSLAARLARVLGMSLDELAAGAA